MDLNALGVKRERGTKEIEENPVEGDLRMFDMAELEHRISDRRDEVERGVREAAKLRQVRSGEREPHDSGPRMGLRLRLARLLIRVGSRLVGDYSPPASPNSTRLYVIHSRDEEAA